MDICTSLYGRAVYPGIAEGIALVCPDSIAGNSGSLGDDDGIIYEASNINRGVCIKDRILVLPCAKGSAAFSAHFKSAAMAGFAPAGWIVTHIDSRVGGAIASVQRPAVCDFADVDPIQVIRTGDLVRIDGSTGKVEILKRAAD